LPKKKRSGAVPKRFIFRRKGGCFSQKKRLISAEMAFFLSEMA